jgi:hypothetical protein
LFLAWYGLLESYIDSLLYKKVSKNPKNYCTYRSLPKIAKTSFRADCLLGVNFTNLYFEGPAQTLKIIYSEGN